MANFIYICFGFFLACSPLCSASSQSCRNCVNVLDRAEVGRGGGRGDNKGGDERGEKRGDDDYEEEEEWENEGKGG